MHAHEDVNKMRGSWWRITLLWILAMLLRYAVGVLSVLMCVIVVPNLQAQSNSAGPLQTGEFLRYSVRWLFIRLGTVEITQQTDSLYPDRALITLTAKSAAGIPFIDLHLTHRSLVGLRPMRVLEERITSDEEENEKLLYWHDHETKRIVMTERIMDELVRSDTIDFNDLCYDAVTLLMYARMHATSIGKVSLPTLTDFELGMTDLAFSGDTQSVEVDAFEDDIRSIVFDGYAHWEGDSYGGFSGEFKGWLSDDEAAVPLRAEVNIFLGSIVLELESYSRKDWKPGVREFVETFEEQ